MNKIILRDVIEFVSQIEDNSIDSIIADPPYNIGKDFGNESDNLSITNYVEWSKKWIKEFERVLKPTGTGFIYGFSEILAHISVNLSLPHRWLIWYYTNKNTSSCKFWQRSHEGIIVFWKNSDVRIFNEDEVRESYTESFLNNAAGKTRKGTKGRFSKGDRITIYKANELGAMGRDVIKIPALAGGAGSKEKIFYCHNCSEVFIGDKKKHRNHKIEEHPTQKPFELTNKLLMSCLPLKNLNNSTVYIPFAGSGSECLCCRNLGTNFLSSDINPTYVENGNKLLTKYGKDKDNQLTLDFFLDKEKSARVNPALLH